MVGHPGKRELSASCAPDCVGVEGPRTAFEIGTGRDGQPVYGSIPYHRASTLIEIKPYSRNGALQSISYTWYHLQARPDRPGVYCLSANPRFYQISWVDSSGPVTSPRYDWKNDSRYQLDPLLDYLYSLYVSPSGHIAKDPSITVRRVESSPDAPWDIRGGGSLYQGCKILSFSPPWGIATTVFEHVEDGRTTIIKDYYRDNQRRFQEESLLAQIHAQGVMPGVVRLVSHEEVMADGQMITAVRSARSAATKGDAYTDRWVKMRLIFSSVGKKLSGVSNLRELLMVFFDLNESK